MQVERVVLRRENLCHRRSALTIQITNPEVEALIQQRLESGGFENAEEVILQALRSSVPESPPQQAAPKSLIEVFKSIRGLADDIEFPRNPSTGRPTPNLS